MKKSYNQLKKKSDDVWYAEVLLPAIVGAGRKASTRVEAIENIESARVTNEYDSVLDILYKMADNEYKKILIELRNYASKKTAEEDFNEEAFQREVANMSMEDLFNLSMNLDSNLTEYHEEPNDWAKLQIVNKEIKKRQETGEYAELYSKANIKILLSSIDKKLASKKVVKKNMKRSYNQLKTAQDNIPLGDLVEKYKGFNIMKMEDKSTGISTDTLNVTVFPRFGSLEESKKWINDLTPEQRKEYYLSSKKAVQDLWEFGKGVEVREIDSNLYGIIEDVIDEETVMVRWENNDVTKENIRRLVNTSTSRKTAQDKSHIREDLKRFDDIENKAKKIEEHAEELKKDDEELLKTMSYNQLKKTAQDEKQIAQEFRNLISKYCKNINKVVNFDNRIVAVCNWSNRYKKELSDVINTMKEKYPQYSFDVAENASGEDILASKKIAEENFKQYDVVYENDDYMIVDKFDYYSAIGEPKPWGDASYVVVDKLNNEVLRQFSSRSEMEDAVRDMKAGKGTQYRDIYKDGINKMSYNQLKKIAQPTIQDQLTGNLPANQSGEDEPAAAEEPKETDEGGMAGAGEIPPDELGKDDFFPEDEKPKGVPDKLPEEEAISKMTVMDFDIYTSLVKQRGEAEAQMDLDSSKNFSHQIESLIAKYQEDYTPGEISPEASIARRMKAHTMLNRDDYQEFSIKANDKLFDVFDKMPYNIIGASILKIASEGDHKVIDMSIRITPIGREIQRDITIRMNSYDNGEEIKFHPFFWDTQNKRFSFEELGFEKMFGLVDTEALSNLEME